MITRHYFISAQTPQSAPVRIYGHIELSKTSFFAHSLEMLLFAKKELLKQFKECGYGGDKIDIQAFNRI